MTPRRTQHGYDRASNRLYRKQTVQALHDELYTHDDLHRLTDVERGTLNGARDALTSLAFAQDWGLDPLGNWARFREDDDGDTAWSGHDKAGFASLYPPCSLVACGGF